MKVIDCPCGYVLQAATEDELVAQAQEHAREAHDMALTREQALSMSRPA